MTLQAGIGGNAMSGAPLVEQSDVEAALMRPLTDTESRYVDALCSQATDLLEQQRPGVRLSVTMSGSPSPGAVAAMLAIVVKRSIVNPRGLWSTSETDGDYAYTETYPGQRAGSDAGTPGELEITAADLRKIDRPRSAVSMRYQTG